MDTARDRWQRLKKVFGEVVDMNDDERHLYLQSLRDKAVSFEGELAELLNIDRAAGQFLEKGFEPTPEMDDLIDKSLGGYRVVREIGRGGMGTVFEAVREDGEFEKRVAIKLTGYNLFSSGFVRRFKNEKKILAGLEHPNIVRLFDAGVTSNHVPYYVMEYVEGVPITEYCRKNGLSTEDRLKLFTQVLGAVAFAHRKLVVHRDLKPSNIFVSSEGQVKLLDFGIAKTLEDENQTLTAGSPLTPEYAAPEQIDGREVSTVTDIYSLGLLMFEILTQLSPRKLYRADGTSIYKAILTTEPLAPSATVLQTAENHPSPADPVSTQQLARQLRGDLDAIILKCIEKEPDNRFASATLLLADIQSYLSGHPVSALSPSRMYRSLKFARRNFAPLVAAGLALILILAGSAAAVYQATIAQEQKRLADQRFLQVRKIANALIFDYHDEIARLEGSTALREKLVTDAAAYLDAIAGEDIDDPQLLFELGVAYRKIGDVLGAPYQANLGRLDEAIDSYQKSVEILDGRLAAFPRGEESVIEMIESYRSLAMAELRRYGKEQAGQTSLIALDKLEAHRSDRSDSKAIQLLHLELLLSLGGTVSWDINFARTYYEKGYNESERLLDVHPADDEIRFLAGKFNQRLSSNYRWGVEQGDTVSADEIAKSYDLALLHARKYVDHFTGIKNVRPRELADAYLNLSYNLISLDRHDEALVWIEKAEEKISLVKLRDPDNAEIRLDELGAYNARRKILTARGNFHQAKKVIDRALGSAIIYSDKDPTNIEALSWVGHFAKEGLLIARKINDGKSAEHYEVLFNAKAKAFRTVVGSEWSGSFGF